MTRIRATLAGHPTYLATLTAAAALMLALLGAPSASALDQQSNEEKLIKNCEERLCAMLLRKDAKGDDLKCELTKTWAKSTIKGADSHTLKWGYGDARCSVKLHIPRADIVAALTSHEYSFEVAPHTADCLVEQDGEAQTVKATLAPKIVFKDGKAEKVWVNLKSIKGPAGIKTSLWLAANLSDKVGLFHRPMLKGINGFINKYCPKHYPNLAQTSIPKDKEVAATKPARPAPNKKNGG